MILATSEKLCENLPEALEKIDSGPDLPGCGRPAHRTGYAASS